MKDLTNCKLVCVRYRYGLNIKAVAPAIANASATVFRLDHIGVNKMTSHLRNSFNMLLVITISGCLNSCT